MPSSAGDRKSTRLNSSHLGISYAVFCWRSEEHTSELQSLRHLVCRLLLEKTETHPIAVLLGPDRTSGASWRFLWVPQQGAPLAPTRYTPRRVSPTLLCEFFFFFNYTATTEIYTLSLHDALPICNGGDPWRCRADAAGRGHASHRRSMDFIGRRSDLLPDYQRIRHRARRRNDRSGNGGRSAHGPAEQGRLP